MSAIVVREPRNKGGFNILRNAATDSHSDLIEYFQLRDDGKLRFARVEFSPPSDKDLASPEKYALRIDEERTPNWFDNEMKEAVAGRMRGWVKAMIATKDTPYLLGGHWIVPKGVEVKVGPFTVVTENSGTVTYNYGTVTENYGTVTENSGTVTYNYGTVTKNSGTVTYNSGTVTENSSPVTKNSGTVTYNYGAGTVTCTDGAGTVTDNYGTVTKNYGTVTYNSGTGTEK